MSDTIAELIGALKELKTATILIAAICWMAPIGLLAWNNHEMNKWGDKVLEIEEQVLELNKKRVENNQRFMEWIERDEENDRLMAAKITEYLERTNR